MTSDQEILSRAQAAFTSRDYRKALEDFESLASRHPDVGELHINIGAARRALGDIEGAEAAYKDAIERLPKSGAAWFNLANLYREIQRPQAALDAYRQANLLQPGTPEILNNYGVELYDSGNVEEALSLYDEALAIKPDFSDAETNRGNALQRLNRMDEAKSALTKALRLQPDNPFYQINFSSYCAANAQYDDALKWAERAIGIAPDYVEARLKRASLLIQQGNLESGFAAYEDRWQIPHWHALPKTINAPMWQGENLAGKELLVWNEQGFGDALMYARFLPRLQQMGADVTLMCEKALMRLMRQSFDGVHVVDLASPPPAADYHVSIMSLPARLGVTRDTLRTDSPYLHADENEVEIRRTDIARLSHGKPAVGLIWAGNPGQAHDYARSMTSDDIAPLLDNDDIAFFNLLVGPRGDTWRDPRLIDVRDRLTDFAATAALMTSLDLVVSVDSAPAHLAGGLGVDLRILLSFDPDSRYFLARSDSPWYPSARLIRQKSPGNWAESVLAMQHELTTLRRPEAPR